MRYQEREWAQQLLDGAKGTAVLEKMQKAYPSACTLASKVSLVRKFYLTAHPKDEMVEKGYLHKSYAPALAELEAAVESLNPKGECAGWVRRFLEANLHAQYKQWSMHRSERFCFSEGAVEAALKGMQIFPDRMSGFHISSSTYKKCQVQRQQRTIDHNENLIEVADGDALVAQVAALLATPEKRTLSELIVGLCGCSGRRMSEIANPETTFERLSTSADHERVVVFGGQLKKSELQPYPAYPIPLVGTTANAFLAAVTALRKKQGRKLDGLTIAQIGSRYQSNISKCLPELVPALFDTHARAETTSAKTTRRPADPPPRKPTLHDLRGFYAYASFHAFSPWRKTFPRVLMYLLGHASMGTFFNYDDFDVGNFTLAYGPFPLKIVKPRAKAGDR